MTDEQKVKRRLLRAMKTITECMGILAGDCKDKYWTAAHFPAYEHVNGKEKEFLKKPVTLLRVTAMNFTCGNS